MFQNQITPQKPQLDILADARSLTDVPDTALIRRFQTRSKGKTRSVNDPHPRLKTMLKDWNSIITAHYVDMLKTHDISHIPHAYLPERSIQSNANVHKGSDIIQFDFTGFYDSCRFEYFIDTLSDIDPKITPDHHAMIKRLVIDTQTGGVTQGLPVSGALAGITLIPFWVELKRTLPENIVFTQYSDDLTFSHKSVRTPEDFTIAKLSQYIYEALAETGLDFKLNADKTRKQVSNYRKVTGIRINHHNQTTPAKADYRFLRHALHILSKSDDLSKELDAWDFKSKAAFIGKVSHMRSIDETGKIDRLIMKYRDTCRKHDIFTTWIDAQYEASAFA